jgi:serine O-acetyltransferase
MNESTKSYEQLERVIDRVAADYDGSKEIDNLESAALPNRRAVIEALNHLKPVIYMGFYATRALSVGNLRYAISDHLYPAFETLTDEIRRAMAYQQMCGRSCPEMLGEWAEGVVLRLFEKLPELRRELNEDVIAAYNGDPAAKGIEEVIFSYPAIQAITTYRIAHELHEQQVPMIPRIMTEHAHGKTGIDIHPGAKIGRRFFIDHGTGVVIGETSVIGDDVKLYQGVTLGALSLPRDNAGDLIRNGKRHPTLEDKVTIYSGATVLGGQTVIGEGSVIGGNVWVVESVPPHSKITFSSRTQVSEIRARARKAS